MLKEHSWSPTIWMQIIPDLEATQETRQKWTFVFYPDWTPCKFQKVVVKKREKSTLTPAKQKANKNPVTETKTSSDLG